MLTSFNVSQRSQKELARSSLVAPVEDTDYQKQTKEATERFNLQNMVQAQAEQVKSQFQLAGKAADFIADNPTLATAVSVALPPTAPAIKALGAAGAVRQFVVNKESADLDQASTHWGHAKKGESFSERAHRALFITQEQQRHDARLRDQLRD